jgi:hypothetical protein
VAIPTASETGVGGIKVIGYHATCQSCGRWEEITKDEFEARCPTHWYIVTTPYLEFEYEEPELVRDEPRIYCSAECAKNAITTRLNGNNKILTNLKRDYPGQNFDGIKLPR